MARVERALRVGVFEEKRFGNCSNNGISSRFDSILLLCDDGPVEVDLDNPPEELCVLVRRVLFGREADYVRPYKNAEGCGWMFGGDLVYASDARFPSNHPLCLHDRDESPELNERLSR